MSRPNIRFSDNFFCCSQPLPQVFNGRKNRGRSQATGLTKGNDVLGADPGNFQIPRTAKRKGYDLLAVVEGTPGQILGGCETQAIRRVHHCEVF